MRILPIASGKGGVGKSMVAANLAVAMAQAGKRVVLADLDLGASNLHLAIGHRAPTLGLGTFLNDTKTDFNSLLAETDFPNLWFLPGDTELPGTANLKASQKNALAKRLLSLDADILIIDLGAGTHQFILDFFLLSNQGIIVTAPTVTATLNAYLFLKNAVFRLMYASFGRNNPAIQFIETLRKDGTSLQRLYIPKILEEVEKIDPKSHKKFRDRLDYFRPRLIMNLIDDPKAAENALRIRRSCTQYLGIQLEHLGIIYRDSLQDMALSSRMPILKYKNESLISQAIYRIADKIFQSDEDSMYQDKFLNEATVDESYVEANLEAEIDWDARMDYIEDLLHCTSLSPGDMSEIIQSQQFEINQLRKENNLYKAKIAKAIEQGFAP